MLRAVLLLALAGLAALSLLSWLGEVAPPLDVLSHLRLHFAAAAALLVLALLARRQFWAAALAGALVAANLAGSLGYPHRSAEAAAGDGGRTLKIVSINTRWSVDNADRIVAFLEKEQADIVALQEVTPAKRQQILPSLAGLYPWQVECSDGLFCRVALLSRHAWTKAAARLWGPGEVAVASASFGPALGDLTVMGVHLTRPWPWWNAQRRQVASLVPMVQEARPPVVMLGDFNATPWSRVMRTISSQTGLLPAGGYHPSWPLRLSKLQEVRLFPQLQLDQMLMPEGVTLLSIDTGPDLGSDHLPLIARIAVPVK